MNDLRHLAYQWMSNTLASQKRNGRIGRNEGSNIYTIDVPGKPNMIFVTYENDTIGEAYAKGIAKVANAPVVIDLVNGRPTVIGVNDVFIANLTGTQHPQEEAPPHTHAIGSGNAYPIEGRRLEPGLVMVYSGMVVRIRPFWYWWDGTLKYFTETYQDLTAYIPATSNRHYWALVGVNPATATVSVVVGSETPTSMTLLAFDLAELRPDLMIPLAGIRLTNGMTAIANEQLFIDARVLYTPDFGTGGNLATIAYPTTLPASKNHLWLGPVTVTAKLTINGKLKVAA